MEPDFATRLNRLFDLVRPVLGQPFTAAEVVDALREKKVRISRPYLSQLRSGQRVNPAPQIVDALAEFFRVRPDFFTDDTYYTKVEQQLAITASVEDAEIRHVMARASELSQNSMKELIDFVEQLAQRERATVEMTTADRVSASPYPRRQAL